MAVMYVVWKGFVDRSCLSITESRTDQPLGLCQASWGSVCQKKWVSNTANYSFSVPATRSKDAHKEWINWEQSPERNLSFCRPSPSWIKLLIAGFCPYLNPCPGLQIVYSHFPPRPRRMSDKPSGLHRYTSLFPEDEGPGRMGAWALLMLLPPGLWHSSGIASGDSVTGSCLCRDRTVFSWSAELYRRNVQVAICNIPS